MATPFVVERLIRAGAKAAAENVFGVTPMSEAALIGSEPVIRELLAAGVDPDSPNPEGETALMLVVRTGQIDAAELLIDAGADVNAKERWAGQTALMWAGAQLQPEMVKLLLANGAEVDARSTVRQWTRKVSSEPRPKELAQGGLTPLMFAARTGCIECAELLLDAGADINLPDPYGVTPLLVATLNLQNDFAAYLVEKGADISPMGSLRPYAAVCGDRHGGLSSTAHAGIRKSRCRVWSSPSCFSSAVLTRTVN